ncbi:hypothetical protein E5F05_08050 [Deinococcus metallilatus]|uniref:Uncharacterized protein n=1 Tax=Deinococcus metallilatus TaxID=1211322 RepID=A0AAJ5F4C1_9DEIO|nr:hypothetical protein [Deinococcus metallilatus]MBB5295585.1 hypothetical protein [Deinococcus metallilatus]QBY07905.1 hypothetical protein E5F05_08050 [Deinococcus metallilatus]RXJ12798.1 hypothetical protein ERJ73_06875 [Deinococcus metallilatus]TLK27280.1 hypothetical protein FCS05_10440 [Deinococcus metallilatus]GMA16264.1 hypothetical protein GCM10025871_25950 [Deinococcus metallilatus]
MMRSAALAALWVQVVGTFGLAAYALWRGNFSQEAWFSGIEAFLGGLVLAWWTVLLGRFTAGRVVPLTDGTLVSLRIAFPGLTSFRLVLWFLTLLGVLAGLAPEANTVALTALFTVWFAAILASNAVYGTLARLAPNPADLTGRRRLADWLNVAAALSLGMTVFNLVPIAGFSTLPTLTDQLVYGLSGGLDVLATLLALGAVQAAPWAEG